LKAKLNRKGEKFLLNRDELVDDGERDDGDVGDVEEDEDGDVDFLNICEAP